MRAIFVLFLGFVLFRFLFDPFAVRGSQAWSDLTLYIRFALGIAASYRGGGFIPGDFRKPFRIFGHQFVKGFGGIHGASFSTFLSTAGKLSRDIKSYYFVEISRV